MRREFQEIAAGGESVRQGLAGLLSVDEVPDAFGHLGAGYVDGVGWGFVVLDLLSEGQSDFDDKGADFFSKATITAIWVRITALFSPRILGLPMLVELHDITRFNTADELAAYLELTSSLLQRRTHLDGTYHPCRQCPGKDHPCGVFVDLDRKRSLYEMEIRKYQTEKSRRCGSQSP